MQKKFKEFWCLSTINKIWLRGVTLSESTCHFDKTKKSVFLEFCEMVDRFFLWPTIWWCLLFSSQHFPQPVDQHTKCFQTWKRCTCLTLKRTTFKSLNFTGPCPTVDTIMSKERIETLFRMIHDNYEENRELALALLLNNYTVHLVKNYVSHML